MDPETTEDRLCWIDVETTGLEDDAALLELGAVVTAADLTPIAAFHAYAKHDVDALRMTHWAWQTHSANGLLDLLRKRRDVGVLTMGSLCDAGPFGTLPGFSLTGGLLPIDSLSEYLEEFVRKYAAGAPLAGASVSFDKKILARHCPRALQHLHYRIFDVSSFREALRRWRPDLTLPPKSEEHRVFSDLAVSVQSARLLMHLLTDPGSERRRADLDALIDSQIEVEIEHAPDLMVSEWHGRTLDGDAHEGTPLHVFMGWTWDEYVRWVEKSIPPPFESVAE